MGTGDFMDYTAGIEDLIKGFLDQQVILQRVKEKEDEEKNTLHFDNVIESTAEVVEEVVYVG